ncbi:MAG: hypothetical protein O2955_08770 [Planctomycetota bacterium]|nr:hypothetical protein [Planctomycetota bacterium]MDA1212598.1 hypothetical protein [Planctomycetota bacterium]
MPPQEQAYQILKQAREILAKRLVERILDSSDEILDDAAGESYSNEIEQVYEQCGTQLQHVQNMLNLLPAPESSIGIAASSTLHAPIEYPEPDVEVHTTMVGLSETDHAFAQMLPDRAHTPSNDVDDDTLTSATLPTFGDFAQKIMVGNITAAAQVLSLLLDLPMERARKCTEWFHRRMQSDENFLQQARKLRESVRAANVNDTLDILWHCFGLQGFEAVAIWPRLRSQLTGQQ